MAAIASDMMPAPVKVNSLQAITRLRPKKDQDFGVFAFALNRDMINKDGTLDDFHGVIFHLGSFAEDKAAEDHAKNIITLTKHPGIVVAKYGIPFPLSSKYDPNVTEEVRLDHSGKLVELETAQYKKERTEYEKRIKLEKDIIAEAEAETDPEHIEHFKRQAYLAVKNYSKYQYLLKQMEEARKDYDKRAALVKDHYQRYPDHEANWLLHLKEKLTERGEKDLYTSIETSYKELREELLGLNFNAYPNETNEVNGAYEVNEVNETNEVNEANEANETDEINEANTVDFTNPYDASNSSYELTSPNSSHELLPGDPPNTPTSSTNLLPAVTNLNGLSFVKSASGSNLSPSGLGKLAPLIDEDSDDELGILETLKNAKPSDKIPTKSAKAKKRLLHKKKKAALH